MAIAWYVECNNALAADRRENGLVRPDWPKVPGEFIGTCRNTCYGEGESARRRNLRIERADTSWISF
jgi:hypothetical protein